MTSPSTNCLSFPVWIPSALLGSPPKHTTCTQIFVSGSALEVKVKSLSCVQLFATPWTVAHQSPLSMGFSRQEYWSGLPFPSPGDFPNPGIEPGPPTLQADALPSERDPNDHSIHVPLILMSLKKVLGRPFTHWKRQLWEKNRLLAPKEV